MGRMGNVHSENMQKTTELLAYEKEKKMSPLSSFEKQIQRAEESNCFVGYLIAGAIAEPLELLGINNYLLFPHCSISRCVLTSAVMAASQPPQH